MTKAKASPAKAFFVRMLTRDITLDDCILDLIDNSIDGAWKTAGAHPTELRQTRLLGGLEVNVDFDAESFVISDNCGGITLDDAINYAFTFGRMDEEAGEPAVEAAEDLYSVGVYGIGMKRAVFKLGSHIDIDSTFVDDGGLGSFRVPIRVGEWLGRKSGDWDFDIDELEPGLSAGVTINVTQLTADTSQLLGSEAYERNLRRVIARDYMFPLMHGLTIRVNGQDIAGKQLSFLSNENFSPMRDSYDDGEVRVEILAGMWTSPPDTPEPEEDGRRGDDTSGWYVLCNGRAVLAADRTVATNWGAELPRWHSQYGGFAGVALFSSADPSLLPMTTTKRSVDLSSQMYRRALGRMAEPTRAWIRYTNGRKADVEAAKGNEAGSSVHIAEIPQGTSFSLPTPKPAKKIQVANVNYSVSLVRMRRLSTALGSTTMSYREVGLKTFNIVFDDYVDEN